MAKEKILLVDDVEEITSACAHVLGEKYEVRTANGAEAGLKACREEGPFAVVISDDDMPGMRGTELLSRVAEEFPESVRIMLTGIAEVDLVVKALHEGGIYRFLSKPFDLHQLLDAVDAAVKQHCTTRASRSVSSELRTSKRFLQRRVSVQTSLLDRLNRYSVDLNSLTSLEEIACLAAETTSAVLGGRGVHIQVWAPDTGNIGVECGAGPEMGTSMHREPLVTPNGQIGELVLDELNPEGERLRAAELDLLRALVSSTAIAVATQFRRGERDRAQHATILALARLAEQRDNETGKHLERVSLYCKLFAEGLVECGLHRDIIDEQWVQDIVRSSPLHDIGKVGIPDSILLKPGKLTPDEWTIMMRHAEIGATTIDSVIREDPEQSFLRMARDIAWCHHEKWDGNGYPRGLKGEEIPLSARILALADVYDALTTVRPYKSAWTHEAALDWMKAQSGSHFDPDLVQVLIAKQYDANRIRTRLADLMEEITV